MPDVDRTELFRDDRTLTLLPEVDREFLLKDGRTSLDDGDLPLSRPLGDRTLSA